MLLSLEALTVLGLNSHTNTAQLQSHNDLLSIYTYSMDALSHSVHRTPFCLCQTNVTYRKTQKSLWSCKGAVPLRNRALDPRAQPKGSSGTARASHKHSEHLQLPTAGLGQLSCCCSGFSFPDTKALELHLNFSFLSLMRAAASSAESRDLFSPLLKASFSSVHTAHS